MSCASNVRGTVATIQEAAKTVERLMPDADIEVSDEGGQARNPAESEKRPSVP